MGLSGLILGVAGGYFGWYLSNSDFSRADMVLQSAMTPLGVFSAVVLAVSAPSPENAQRQFLSQYERLINTVKTCAPATIVAFISCTVTLGISEGPIKAGAVVGTFMAIGLVIGLFTTLISREEKLQTGAPVADTNHQNGTHSARNHTDRTATPEPPRVLRRL